MNPLTVFSRFIAFVCGLLLVIALPLCLLAFDVGRIVFNPPLVKQVATELVTSSDLIPAALQWFSEQRAEERYQLAEAAAWVGEPDVVQLIEFLDIDDWRTIRWEVLTDEMLADWVSVSVDGTYAWIDSEDHIPMITWDLQELINRVDSEHGTKAITVAYDALPPCTDEQITDFKNRLDAAPPGTKVLYNLCEFPDPWHADQFSDYIESLSDLVTNVPAQLALTEELSRIEDTQGVGPEIIKGQLRLIRTLMTWAPLIPVLFLVLILVFAVRSLRGLGRWWGIPLTLGSLLALLGALVYRPPIIWFLGAGPLSEVPPLIRDEASTGILQLAVEAFRPLLWQSLVITLIGLALIVVSFVVKEKQKPVDQGAVESPSG
jgi:hypothetical protein